MESWCFATRSFAMRTAFCASTSACFRLATSYVTEKNARRESSGARTAFAVACAGLVLSHLECGFALLDRLQKLGVVRLERGLHDSKFEPTTWTVHVKKVRCGTAHTHKKADYDGALQRAVE
eukprot:1994524-Prymnesium_polylepis.1